MDSNRGIFFSNEDREHFLKLLERYSSITLLSHIYPDADAIGTSLGVYHLLKNMGYRVEIANATPTLPIHLNFLDGFYKIKKRMEYKDSLIISCDCGSLDRLGFDLNGRDIINIDHHISNTEFGVLNIIRAEAVSSSEVAYNFFKPIFEIPYSSAEAFYTALISDTRYFTTSNTNKYSFEMAQELIDIGIDVGAISQAMLRRSLASLRILGRVLESLELHLDAKIATMQITREDFEVTGAKYSDIDGIVEYAKSLVTVDIAILLVERLNSYKVSLRSNRVNLLPIAKYFGGGGHILSAGFEVDSKDYEDKEELKDKILEFIKKEGVITNNATQI